MCYARNVRGIGRHKTKNLADQSTWDADPYLSDRRRTREQPQLHGTFFYMRDLPAHMLCAVSGALLTIARVSITVKMKREL